MARIRTRSQFNFDSASRQLDTRDLDSITDPTTDLGAAVEAAVIEYGGGGGGGGAEITHWLLGAAINDIPFTDVDDTALSGWVADDTYIPEGFVQGTSVTIGGEDDELFIAAADCVLSFEFNYYVYPHSDDAVAETELMIGAYINPGAPTFHSYGRADQLLTMGATVNGSVTVYAAAEAEYSLQAFFRDFTAQPQISWAALTCVAWAV